MKGMVFMSAMIAALAAQANTPPVITNVRAEQRKDTKLVDIYYDAADADNDALKVRIEISDNDGAKYSVPAFSLTGDVGEGIMPGTGKHIVWDAGTDWDGEYSDQMRVKVFAIDAQGFPGMEWGNEVPLGGFLMGQDGGAEGSGPSRHVVIPWSYWLSKYEVTAKQNCQFLNAALATEYIARNGTTEVVATAITGERFTCPEGTLLCKIGDTESARWNVNKFEVTNADADFPISVTWYGAMAFCRYYGYDLPTEAEWERAARGPNKDGQNAHTLYPWGNGISDAYANICASNGLKSVGYYNGNQIPFGPDTINGYGLYDVIGNIPEWTQSSYVVARRLVDARIIDDSINIEEYPQHESLDEEINTIDFDAHRVKYWETVQEWHMGVRYDVDQIVMKVVKGIDSGKIHERNGGALQISTPTIGLYIWRVGKSIFC